MHKGFSFSWPVDLIVFVLALPVILIMLPTFFYEAYRESHT